jgi:hypothetical protein
MYKYSQVEQGAISIGLRQMPLDMRGYAAGSTSVPHVGASELSAYVIT